MKQKTIITPKTKILDLITDYPELEEVLFDMSPAFRQLKNPVLRKTVARVTTLQQAALVGGLKVEDLVNHLRSASGTNEIPARPVETDNYPSPDHPSPDHPSLHPSLPGIPLWFNPENIIRRLDARDMLNRGEHPVGQVLADLHHLQDNGIYELIAPFYPAPLIDKATGIGFNHHVAENQAGEFHIYFIRKPNDLTLPDGSDSDHRR